MNMLSAEKVRLHGLRDKKWTTQDKIVQYKGIVKLFQGDKKLHQSDAKVAVQSIMNEINTLSRRIYKKRSELDSKINGGRHLIENILVHHKSMRLAYRHLPADKIIEALKQSIYYERRRLDVIQFRRHNKENRLAELLLERGDIENSIMFASKAKTPLEIECGKVTSKVQDAILLTEAAISVRNTYQTIIHLLVKDSIYYDQLLLTLKRDLLQQNKCMYQVTVLGQVAVEYLDDRKNEYKKLEGMVKRDVKFRREHLNESSEFLKLFPKKMMNIIRKDDDFYDYNVINEDLPGKQQLEENISFIEKSLEELKENVLVSHYSNILPCLQEQVAINSRLKEIQRTFEAGKLKLLKSVENARLKYDEMLNSTNDGFHGYKLNKRGIKDETLKYKDLVNQYRLKKSYFSNALLNLRIALQGLDYFCKPIKRIEDKDDRTDREYAVDRTEYISTHSDGMMIIKQLIPKLENLVNKGPIALQHDIEVTPEEYMTFSNLKLKMSVNIIKDLDHKELMDEYGDELIMEDSNVPSRNEIKDRSRRIVESHKNADLAA